MQYRNILYIVVVLTVSIHLSTCVLVTICKLYLHKGVQHVKDIPGTSSWASKMSEITQKPARHLQPVLHSRIVTWKERPSRSCWTGGWGHDLQAHKYSWRSEHLYRGLMTVLTGDSHTETCILTPGTRVDKRPFRWPRDEGRHIESMGVRTTGKKSFWSNTGRFCELICSRHEKKKSKKILEDRLPHQTRQTS